MSFHDWKNQPAYIGPGYSMDTMEQAMLVFYDGVSQWIQGLGYKWLFQGSLIANKFVHLCYMIDTANMNSEMEIPEPRHRNYLEDRDTFDLFVDTAEFIEFLEPWKFRSEVVGTRFEYLLKEFCYIWIDPSSGKPGSFTQRIFDAEAEAEAEDEPQYAGPDTTSKKKWDLY